MNKNKIKQILIKTINLDNLIIKQNNNHFQIFAISKIFIKLNQVQRQQIIYKPLMKYIMNNEIHSLSINTYTLEEWNQFNSLN